MRLLLLVVLLASCAAPTVTPQVGGSVRPDLGAAPVTVAQATLLGVAPASIGNLRALGAAPATLEQMRALGILAP